MKIVCINYVLMLSLLITSCVSSSKRLQQGEYDKAIVKAAKVLQKKPTKTNEVKTLKKAYNLANNKDLEAIKLLKLSGQPDIYEKVVIHYRRLINRQEVIERLSDEVLVRIGFVPVDYSQEFITSKNKAAKFFYAHAIKLLEEGDKQSARQAWDELAKVKNYFPVYQDVDDKMNEAYSKGVNHVIFMIANESRTVLPEDFEDELLKISLKNINKQWLNFDTYVDKNINYDYSIYLNIKHIEVSPERVKEIQYEESKEIEDGFEYVLDKNGNVKKDEDGNDIKVPRYSIITCYVTETRLNKRAIVSGSLDFYDERSGQLVKTMPIASEFVFDYRLAIANGNLDALKKKTRRLIKHEPIPFPTDLQLIFDTNENLKSKVKRIINSNRAILLN
ncbi:MAG TPA: hypothetical protein QF480_09415 [Bacteroidales bacterium]|nr:hypothetical protein [Bacteroidales bacterium]|tara:strand:+ start:2291 stop:3460 length:1170 start_codon:yes stop_codon:yes gene_type:complete